ISAPAGATVLVNVSGDSAQMQNMGLSVSGTDRQHVLFNFAGATALTLGGIAVEGSVLAPRANVTFNNGNLEGTLVARSLAGSGEFHNFPSQASVPTAQPPAPPSPPPAPAPPALSGFVYLDANNDGLKQETEAGIAGVKVTLTGTNDLGQAVSLAATTSPTGAYAFSGLRPGTYTLTETQRAGYLNGKATVGSQGGTAGLDKFFIALGAGVQGVNNNFGELAAPLTHGQTATIGFWQGPNGQALLNSFGTTAGGLTLANWLATTLPHLYGKGGLHDLTGRTDADVAALFRSLFAVQGQKVEAPLLAAALAVFTTTNTLTTGTASRALAAKYGFVLTDAGAGAGLYKVGSNGAAFGVASGTSLSVLDLLKRADARVTAGQLFGGSKALTDQANAVFSGVNQAGDIP